MSRRPRRGGMVARVYAFAVATVVLSIVLLFGTIMWFNDPPWMKPVAETLTALARQIGQRHPARAELIAALPAATADLSSRLALYDDTGAVLWRRAGPSPGPPSAAERASADAGRTTMDDLRVVVAVPGHPGVYLVDDRDRPFPDALAVALGGVLMLVLGASLWFARGLARPLRRLEVAARAFGAGDVTARARVRGGGELGAVGAAFDQMAERIALLLRSQRELLADISHELRTPLARIRVALELATEDPDAARDVLADVGVDLSEIDQIIGDLLTVVRLDLPDRAGGVPRVMVSIDELLRRAADRFASVHPGRVLDAVAVPDGVQVRGDAVLLRRALDNLLDNAAKYSAGDASITVTTGTADDQVRIEVIDRGIGMSPDELERAFTPFWRADASRTRGTGGTGLGLALARRVARAHGGDVTLRSAPGAGTTAALLLPAAARPGPCRGARRQGEHRRGACASHPDGQR